MGHMDRRLRLHRSSRHCANAIMSCRHVAGRGAAPCHAPRIKTTLDGAVRSSTTGGQPSQGRRDTAPRRPCAQWHPTGVAMLSVPIPADHPVSYIHVNTYKLARTTHQTRALGPWYSAASVLRLGKHSAMLEHQDRPPRLARLHEPDSTAPSTNVHRIDTMDVETRWNGP